MLEQAADSDLRSLRLRGIVAARWISLNVVVLAGALAVAVWHLALIQGDLGHADYQASLDRVTASAVAVLVLYVSGAAAFLFWFHRAYANLGRLGTPGFRPGWRVGGWFVPVIGFLRARQIAVHAWIGSDPKRLVAARHDGRLRGPLFLHLWWVLWIAGTLGECVYAQLPERSLAEERAATWVLAGAEAAQLVAGILAVVFIRRLTRRQEERAMRLRAFARCMPCATAATTAR